MRDSKLYVVTGGAGFIGHHLVKKIIELGQRVIIIDNFSTGQRERVHPEAKLIEADLRDVEALVPALSGVDGVFHLAALPRVQESIDKPRLTHENNING